MTDVFRATIDKIPIDVDVDAGQLNFLGIPSVLFWLKPSLYPMLAALVQEAGPDLARLLIASEASKGTDEDYHLMVTQLGKTFTEGFLAWGRGVGVAGWGAFELPMLNTEKKEALVRVRNAWELRAQADAKVQWGCPFLQGKIIGIFNHALGCNCWADEAILDAEQGIVEFRVFAAEMTIQGEIQRLREQQLERKRAELAQLEQELHTKQQTILQLSTPVVRLWDGILLLPLVGHIDGHRAVQLMDSLLQAVSENRAAEVIIDITGVPLVDTAVANTLIKTIRAARLLGVECTLVGISAEVAQTLVHLGADLSTVRTQSSLEVGLTHALARQKFQLVRLGERAGKGGAGTLGVLGGRTKPGPTNPR